MSHDLLKRETMVRVPAASAGCQLLDFVAARFTYRSRTEWQEEIAANRFSLANGHQLNAFTTLAAGDQVRYAMPELPEPPVPRRCTVLHDDAHLLVVDKPAGLPCHPAGRFFRHTLWALLREEFGLPHPSLINRLDRETSGIVLVAKDKRTARHCCQLFARRLAEKRYLVLVEGIFPSDPVCADGLLSPDPTSRIRKKVRYTHAREAGSLSPATPSVTWFQRLRLASGLSLLEARPVTGRCHQIRASLLGLGFPVVGDKLYGVDETFFLRLAQDRLTAADHRRLRLSRQALHAAALTLPHPAENRLLSFASPMPAEFSRLLDDKDPL